MARIAGVDLPRNKRMEIALTYIYGIGRALSREILQGGRRLARQAHRRSRRERDPPHPRDDRAQQLKVEGDLRREVPMNIKRLMDLGCYRGLRHRKACRCAASARTPTRAPARARARAGMSQKRAPRPRRRERKPWPRHRQSGEGAKPSRRKKVKKNIQTGIAHIKSTFNNTIVTITDVSGNVVAWSSAGRAASRARASRRRSPRSSPPRTPRARRWSTACASWRSS